MSWSRSDGRAWLGAWLTTGMGPRDPRAHPHLADDRAAFWRHNIATGVPRIRRLVLALVGLNLAAWLTDPALLGDVPQARPAMTEGRLAMTVFGLFMAAWASVERLTRGRAAVALAWVGACGLCAGVAFTMGRIGGPSSAWHHPAHMFLFVSLLAWASPLHRMGLVACLTAVVIAADYGPHPGYLSDPMAGSAITHLLSTAALVLLIGLRLDASRLQLYLYGRAAARDAGRLEAQVAAQTARIQALLDHVERAREDERREIAAELHDEMGQVLTGMRLTLRVARARARDEGSPLVGALEQIGEMMQHLGWAVRNLLVRLRPRVLDDLGIVAAAEWLARRTDELPGVRCTFTAGPDLPTLDLDGGTAAFRVLQEALTNALGHARPERIEVRLERDDEGLRVSVVDDGLGFDPAAVSGAGMGVLGMAERARARGGRFSIDSGPGRGTRVVLTLPAARAVEA